MSEASSFRDLINRVRARDEQAAAELVRLYEPTIRIAIRVRLSDPALRRLLDSMDICQSVLANFFVRAASRITSRSRDVAEVLRQRALDRRLEVFRGLRVDDHLAVRREEDRNLLLRTQG